MKKNTTILSIGLSNIVLVLLSIFLINVHVIAFEAPIKIFPLDNYPQNIEHWINPNDSDYNTSLISKDKQKKDLEDFYHHSYGSLSPWNSEYITSKLKPDPDNKVAEQTIIKLNLDSAFSEQNIINSYGNFPKTPKNKIGYAENFHPHPDQWVKDIITNMKLEQFKSVTYDLKNRAITVENIYARNLPTDTPHFAHFSLPGQGYPFDNLQESAIWVGTPVYIVGETVDKEWSLIITPHHIMVWVKTKGIAKVDEDFVQKWREHAQQGMIAITHTETNVIDTTRRHRFNAYIGTVFPGKINPDSTIEALIPLADDQGNAQTAKTIINNTHATPIPLEATPRNFATVMTGLLGRPYGWGGIYFYNDCSADLQSLYTPFGIWLPRNTSSQKNFGTMVDLSQKTMQERLKYLKDYGKKFTTIIHINGHVMLYIGNFSTSNHTIEQETMVMTFQNIWGLRPKNNSYRAVIGQSVLFPILEQYTEDYDLESLADKTSFRALYFDGHVCTNDELCSI